MANKERNFSFTERMSEHEALMWNIEKDPWLNPSGAAVSILDKPVDMELLKQQIRYGVSRIPRLYQRVVPGFGRLSTPAWMADPEFDFDYHVRQASLPSPGTPRQLLDLVAKLYQEPFDRTRPLWRFVAIDGLEGGGGALWTITHHVISDGIGQLRMAELYQQASRDEPARPEVDLKAIIADSLATSGVKEAGGDFAGGLADNAGRSLSHLIRRQAGIVRRLAGEIVLWPADPKRAVESLNDVLEAVTAAFDQISGSSTEVPGGSPLWKTRSRHRHLEHVRVPLDGLKAAAKSLGGSVNDGFLVGLVEGSVRYHSRLNTEVDAFNTSFVLSTRNESSGSGNAFTPVPVQLPGTQASFADRMAEVRRIVGEAKEQAVNDGGISGLSGLVNLLPTSVVTSTARARSAKLDFVTSNLRGASFTLYCAGAEVLANVAMGPVAGTAANITALSYDGHFDIGLFIDPSAIEDPTAYRDCIDAAFTDFVASHGSALGGAAPAKKRQAQNKSGRKAAAKKKPTKQSKASKKGSATRKKPVKKKASKKRPAKKATAKKRTAAKSA